jgi:DNA-binding HxlR family transcriptional regulator
MKAAVSTVEEGIHLRLAYELAAEDGDLRRGILQELVGRPQRYADLKVLLRGRRDHNLTVALVRLQRDGLISRRTNARQKPPTHTYELSSLGIQVVLAMQTIRPVGEILAAYEAGRKASVGR